MTSRALPLGLLAPLLAGCASAAPCLKPYVPAVPARGVVFAVDGAGGYGATPTSLSQAVADAGLPLAVRPFVWTHGTGRFLAETFAAWRPLRVFIAPGNHDPFMPGSLYRTTEWPANVHIFSSPVLGSLGDAEFTTTPRRSSRISGSPR